MSFGHEWQFLPYGVRFVAKLEQVIAEDTCYEPVFFPLDPDEKMPIIFELSLNEFTRIYAALGKGAELTYPDESHAVLWSFLKALECPLDLCAVITDCLASTFAEINAKLDLNSEFIQTLLTSAGSSGASAPVYIDGTGYDDDYIYGGAMAVVQYMDLVNRRLYDTAEESAADNAQEWVANVLSALPLFQELPFDEIFELSNQYFQTAVSSYNTDYAAFEEPAAFDLYCRIKSNNDTFSYDIWTVWLQNLPVTVSGNAAALLYTKYSPLRQTFLNQIAAFVNSSQSLESYFSDIYNQYFGGLQTGLSLPSGYSCGLPEVLFFDPQPPAPELTLNSDGGQFAGGDARIITTPFEVTVDLSEEREVLSVLVTAAYGAETGAVVIIGATSYPLVRGYWYPGSQTYDYTATIPNVDTDTLLVDLNEQRVISKIVVTVSP